MDLQLSDKLAVVSGSTAGIGYAIADALAREGARVVVNGRTQAAVSEAAAKIGHGAVGFAGDLSDAAKASELARKFPDVDILVNNLGIFEPKPFEEIPDEDWRRFFDVNVLSGVRLARAFLPGMKRRDWGRIIFISSESAIQIPPEMIHYGMTKTAQLAVSRGLAESLAGTRITVNCVLPGPTQSRGVNEFVDQMAKANNMSFEQVQKEFFERVRADFPVEALHHPGRGRLVCGFCGEPAGGGHEWGGAAGRRGCGEERVLGASHRVEVGWRRAWLGRSTPRAHSHARSQKILEMRPNRQRHAWMYDVVRRGCGFVL